MPSPTVNTRAPTRSTFDGGADDDGVVLAAASCPVPMSRSDAVDPEEMLVAALSSCHMLSFLYEARKAGFVVEAYDDAAEAC